MAYKKEFMKSLRESIGDNVRALVFAMIDYDILVFIDWRPWYYDPLRLARIWCRIQHRFYVRCLSPSFEVAMAKVTLTNVLKQ